MARVSARLWVWEEGLLYLKQRLAARSGFVGLFVLNSGMQGTCGQTHKSLLVKHPLPLSSF